MKKRDNYVMLLDFLREKGTQKIYIVGSVGSGKTTLGKKLAKELGLCFYEMDNLIFERSVTGDRKRSDNEISQLLDNLIEKDAWLIEGTCLREIIQPILDESDRIIFLDIPYFLRIHRFSLRYVKQLLHIEEANYKPSIKMYRQMFKWNHSFEQHGYQQFMKRTRQYPEKRIHYKK